MKKVFHQLKLGWITLGNGMGFISTRILLGLVYYLLLTPMALLWKILGKDPLQLKIDKKQSTYWLERKEEFDKDTLINQY